MIKELKTWLKECKAIKAKLLLKKVNVLTKDYEKLVVNTQLNDIEVIIKKINYILRKEEKT